MVALYADGSPALRCRRQLPSSGIRIVLLDIEGSGGSVIGIPKNQTDTARFRNTRTDDRTDLKKTPKTDSDKLPTPTHP